jgi:hypothetical protein
MTHPHYQHDCSSCRYLGSGQVPVLGEQMRKKDHVFDFYVCEGGRLRSFIARYGNEGSEHMSNALLGSAELSHLDLVALFNGLELTVEENERLLKRLTEMYRDKLSVRDYREMSTTPELHFGDGNVLFKID